MTVSEKLKFESEWYKQLIQNSNEKIRLANFIKDTFLQKRTGDLLEVGMGTQPIFAKILSSQVERYTIIEKEPLPNSLTIPQNVEIFHGDFEVTSIDKKFDLIILSHVVYYFSDLEIAIQRALQLLKKDGKLIFIVNEVSSDYARTKKAFSDMAGITFTYTYDLLLRALRNFNREEHTIETYIDFNTHQDLYEYMKLFFDLFPKEYSENKEKIIKWLESNINGNKFFVNQKIITVTN